jgi:hypothetical protein
MTGTGVNVGISVNVGMPVGPDVDVHVAGNVSGAAVACCGETIVGPHEAREMVRMNNAPMKNFFGI